MKIQSFLKKLLVIITVIYVPLQTMAWGTQGHRIIGQVARHLLNAKDA